MELFHGVNVDWMGKAKYFVAVSLIPAGSRLGFRRPESRAILRHRFPRRDAGLRPLLKRAAHRPDSQGT